MLRGDPLLAQSVLDHVRHGLHLRRVAAGGDIHIPASAHQLHALVNKLPAPAHVGGQQIPGRQVRMVQSVEHRLQPALPGAHVHGHQAGGVAQQPRPPGGGGQADELLPGGVGAAVVADGHLYADDGVHHHDILLHAPREGGGGIDVGAGEGVGGDALVVEGLGLGHQVFHAAGDAVCTQQAHHGGDAVGGEHAQLGLRDPGGGALLAAAAGDVDVEVDIPGDQLFPRQVEGLHIRQALVSLNLVINAADPLPGNQNILLSQMLRGVDIRVFQQLDHIAFLRFSSGGMLISRPRPSPRRSAWRYRSRYSPR